MKKWLSIGIGLIISIVILALLIGSDLEVIQEELANGRYVFLIPGSILFIIGIWTRAMRWRVLLKDELPVTDSFHIINIGYFLSGILPLRLGDVARAWLVTRREQPIAGFTALSTIVVERLLDLLAVLAMLGFTIFLIDVPTEVSSAGALMAVMALAGGLVLAFLAAKPHIAVALLHLVERMIPFLKRFNLEPTLTNFIAGIQPMSQPVTAFKVLIWTGISWIFSVGAGFFFLYTMFDEPTLVGAMAFIVLGSFSVALPAVPGNLGPFEGAVVGGLWIGGLISSATAPENAPAVAFAAVLHAVTLAIYVLLGILGLYVQQASLSQIQAGAQAMTEKEPKPQKSTTQVASQPLTDIASEQAS